ncbi:putative peptidoglycan binding protein [Saccharomonospora marina XMU15]|uniref:Putative peptidoglycan binding protein n=1 Tax=Saccharomonospora marina XMU15 TaxID=882083 RepID=H5X3F8_9PSEU|nr:peptidoglycan-binding protein [Saccharomonospora marina]EHR49892.1 putative peptidoglycan binding protein [Saccharomonospora marina XMU15]
MKPLSAGVAVAAGLVALATVPAIASSSAEPTPATATVSMAAVLRAAQIDPQRHDQTVTAGAGPSVTAVERALRARGLLDQQYVDGHFGSKTVSAYAAYQRSLGYEGLAANGLPGRSSLVRLGTDRFEVTHVVGPGARTTHGGKVVNERTKAMLRQAQRLAGHTFKLDQGSYNPGGDPTSAGTHDGGGVVDINVDGMNRALRSKAVKALRQVGFAAWYRTPSQGDWPHHIHAVAINDPDLSSPAQHQVGDYYLGRNGLANEAPDDGPEVKPIRTWEQYRRTR